MTNPRPRTEAELVELVRSSDVRAPDSLHRDVDAMIAERSARARRGRAGGAPPSPARRRGLLAAGAAAAAAVAVVLVAVLGAGHSRALNLRTVSALTLGPATAAAPPESARDHAELAASVDGVAFPYWGERVGWRSAGTRSDRIGGRAVQTVFYTNARGARIAYAIFSGSPAPRSAGGAVKRDHGHSYRVLSQGGVSTVSWLRSGHLCVISAAGIDAKSLLRLASLGEHGTSA